MTYNPRNAGTMTTDRTKTASKTTSDIRLFDAGSLPRAAIETIQSHPNFPAVCRYVAGRMTAMYQGNRLLNTLVNDRGRLIIGYLTMYLHFGTRSDDPRSGLTLSRLKAICTEQNICSAGRAEAMIAVMRLFGYLELAHDVADRRVRRLVPTEKLIASYRERLQVFLNALHQLHPDDTPAAAAMPRIEFLAALVRHFSEHFLAGIRILEHSPELALFADRNAGLMVMFSILLDSCDEGFSPERPVTVSISALSRRFGVSRVHIRKLLRDAADEGFIARPDGEDGAIQILPRLTQATHTFFATTFLFMGHCASAALSEVGPTRH